MKDWIQTAAFIEHFVFEEALTKDVPLSKASTSVATRFGLKDAGLLVYRQTRLLGLLYNLVVFPREQWKRDGLLEIVVERARVDTDLSARMRELLSVGFLRSIRNAVAHARLEVSEHNVVFRDGRSDAEITFEETFPIRDVVNLALVLGRAFHESAQVRENLSSMVEGRK